jgi:hypothetical protein
VLLDLPAVHGQRAAARRRGPDGRTAADGTAASALNSCDQLLRLIFNCDWNSAISCGLCCSRSSFASPTSTLTMQMRAGSLRASRNLSIVRIARVAQRSVLRKVRDGARRRSV